MQRSPSALAITGAVMDPEQVEIFFLAAFFLLVWAIGVAGVRLAGLVSYQGDQFERETTFLGVYQGNQS